MNLRLDIAYDGAPFRGYARQPNLRTVQGELEHALSKLFHHETPTFCAGRTDAGVHALAQVVSVPEAPDDTDLQRVADGLNGMLGPSIAVHGVRVMDESFHARFSARSRTYIYSILESPYPDPFLARTTLWHRRPLDTDLMQEAAGHLVGEHDFSSFGRVPDPEASAVRSLYELSVWRSGSIVKVKARANAFIQQMVRSLVGMLVSVGEGRRGPEEVPGVLEARDRAAAAPVALPSGLCLVAVEYDEGWSKPTDWARRLFEAGDQG